MRDVASWHGKPLLQAGSHRTAPLLIYSPSQHKLIAAVRQKRRIENRQCPSEQVVCIAGAGGYCRLKKAQRLTQRAAEWMDHRKRLCRLGQLASVGNQRQRQVSITGGRQALASLQADLSCGGIQEGEAAHHFSNTLQRIVGGDLDVRHAHAPGGPLGGVWRGDAVSVAMHAAAARQITAAAPARKDPVDDTQLLERVVASLYPLGLVLRHAVGEQRQRQQGGQDAVHRTFHFARRVDVLDTHLPLAPRCFAHNQLPTAAVREPICRCQVGEGANRPR